MASYATTIPPIPPTPASLSAEVDQTAIIVNWSSSSGTTTYQLKRGSASLISGAITAYMDTGVTAGTSYTYSVSACNPTGCSVPITSATVVAGNVQAGHAVNQQYQYDALGRLRKVQVNGTDKTGYDYDNAGNRTNVSE